MVMRVRADDRNVAADGDCEPEFVLTGPIRSQQLSLLDPFVCLGGVAKYVGGAGMEPDLVIPPRTDDRNIAADIHRFTEVVVCLTIRSEQLGLLDPRQAILHEDVCRP